jgi:hypothetical protein
MNLKPTAAFRLNQQAKRSMATILDPHLRGSYKRSMIEAQLSEAIQPRTVKSKTQIKETE